MLGDTAGDGAHILFLCTGNAARSVMAGALLAELLPGARITTAGTHVIDGQPMSWRTKQALESVGAVVPAHRSRQLTEADAASADLLVALAGEHVMFVRRRFSVASCRTATLKRLCRVPGSVGTVREWVAGLHLDQVVLEPWEDVVDPAGGEIEDYLACAREIRQLITRFAEMFPIVDRRDPAR